MSPRPIPPHALTVVMTAEGLFVISTQLLAAAPAGAAQVLFVTCASYAQVLRERALTHARRSRGRVGPLSRESALPGFTVTLPFGSSRRGNLARALRNATSLFQVLLGTVS